MTPYTKNLTDPGLVYAERACRGCSTPVSGRKQWCSEACRKRHARRAKVDDPGGDVKSAKSSAGKLRTAVKSRNLRDISIDLPAELSVRPGVVVWGVAEKQLLECEQLHDGVVFIAGKNLRRWVESECSVGPIRRSPGRRLARDLEVLAIQFDDMQKRAAAQERV